MPNYTRLYSFADRMQNNRVLDFMFYLADLQARKLTKHGQKHGRRGLDRFHYCADAVSEHSPIPKLEFAEASIAIYTHDIGRMFGSRAHYVMGAVLVYLVLFFYRVPSDSRRRIAYAIRYHSPSHMYDGKLKYVIQAWLIAIDKSLDGKERVRGKERAIIDAVVAMGNVRDYCKCPENGPHILRGSGIGCSGDHAHHHLVNHALCDPQPRYEFVVTEAGIVAQFLTGLKKQIADVDLLFGLFGPRFEALLDCFAFLGIPAVIVLVIDGDQEKYDRHNGAWRRVA
jgi:hypothetical protein